MKKILIKGATLVNEGKSFVSDLLIENERIAEIAESIEINENDVEVIDASGLLLIPGAIDDQVHFREPGLTHKAEIYTEAKAAVAGGITSFMEMPNTIPNTLTIELLEEKYKRASDVSLANYSFFMGASNDNIEEVLKVNNEEVCGVKIFMGSSTGNMLVDDTEVLDELFQKCDTLIATHCEDEGAVRKNEAIYREKYGEDVPMTAHPEIRNAEACYLSSSKAVALAKKHNTRLHILHISTAIETELFRNDIPLKDKRITSEACTHHLWFSDEDYAKKGSLIKWNPAVKSKDDREAVRQAVRDGRIDVMATDHAPHTLEEKSNKYFSAPSGGPLVQHAVVAALELVKQGVFELPQVVDKMSHSVAQCFRLKERGYLRKGYFADIVLVDPNKNWTVEKSQLLSKCGWSPFEGTSFSSEIVMTFVNGKKVYNHGKFDESTKGQRLKFEAKR
jgi:dihydroorotase